VPPIRFFKRGRGTLEQRPSLFHGRAVGRGGREPDREEGVERDIVGRDPGIQAERYDLSRALPDGLVEPAILALVRHLFRRSACAGRPYRF
jgi:hypothetical protein